MGKELYKEVKAKVIGEKNRFGGNVVIAELDAEEIGYIVGKGTAEEMELDPGTWYRFYGRWRKHHRYGDQFHFNSFVQCAPLDSEGMIRYLSKAPGIGLVRARALEKHYGSDAAKELRENPEACADTMKLRGFSQEKAIEASKYLKEVVRTESTTIDLMGLFAGRNLPRALARKCIKRWGAEAAEIVRENPFSLLAFRGVGFPKADELYLSLGHDRNADCRQALAAWYRCASDREGNTWISGGAIHSAILKSVGAADARPVDAARWGINEKIIAVERDREGAPWFADASRSSNEIEAATLVAAMMHYGSPLWPRIEQGDLSDHQYDQLGRALVSRIAIFGGSPGTGKTYTAARLISAIMKECGSESVAVVAPTGRAAVRLSESLHANGVNLRARTIHSYLGLRRRDEDDEEEYAFTFGSSDEVDEQFVICDESSMVDLDLFASLLRALRDDGHLLLIGDVNQLPPVGHGAPLRDLIKAGIAMGSLSEIHRNAGAIVKTCAHIRSSEPFELPGALRLDEGGNLMLSEATGLAAAERIQFMLGRFTKADPIWDCQILVAVNEKSPLSRVELNKKLQRQLNSHNRPERESPYWRDDKVVCLKNSFFPACEDLMEPEDLLDENIVFEEDDVGERQFYVANGELGRVMRDEETKTIVSFDAPTRVVRIPKGEAGSDKLSLGYALSVHKSQGGDFKIVIVAVDSTPGAKLVCDRSWLYTAISRAKTACILVGQRADVLGMVGRVKIFNRKTRLCERIGEALALLEKHEDETEKEARADEVHQGGDQQAERSA